MAGEPIKIRKSARKEPDKQNGVKPQGAAERERARQALRESEERFRATFEQAAVGIAHTTSAGRFLEVNEKLCAMLGYTRDELMRTSTLELSPPSLAGQHAQLYQEVIDGKRERFSVQKQWQRKDGKVIWVNRTVSRAAGVADRQPYLIQVIEDITDAKRTEERLERLTRARRVMAECNHILVHAADETGMLESMCRVVVESGGYKMAWVGLATADPMRPVYPAAHAGFGDDVPMSGDAAWSPDGRYRGFMSEVIETGEPHIARNILRDPTHARRLARAKQRGFQSSIALPLRGDGRILGAVAMYAADPDAFDDDEITLLRELSDDIAFGIVSLRERIARRSAEAALRESEQRYRATVEQISVGITRVGFDGVVLDVNQKVCDMLGYARDELIGQVIDRFTHPDDKQRDTGDRSQLAASVAKSLVTEKRFLRKDGGTIWVRRTISAATDDAGMPQYIIGVIEDITTRKQAEEALRESEQRFRETFEQAAVGITRVDLDGVLVDVNQKFCDMLGYPRDELLGKHIRDVTYPDDYGKGAQYRAELAHGEMRSAAGEKRFIRKDGTVMWARRTMSTACDKSGKPLYVISVVEDITERKMLEQRFELAFNQAAVGMTQSSLDGRLLQVNQKYADMLGYTRDELRGMRIEVLTHPDDRAVSAQAMRELRNKEVERVSSEKRLLRKDGAVIWVNRSSSLVQDVLGEPLHFLAVIEDITEHKRIAEAEEREHTLLRTVIDNMPQHVHVKDGEGRYLLINKADQQWRGARSMEEVLGRTTSEFYEPDAARKYLALDQEVLRTGKPMLDREQHLTSAAGGSGWFLTSKIPLPGPDGRPVAVVTINRDITERKEIETERAQLAAIVEGSDDSIVSTTLDRKVLTWNAAAERMFGYTADEVMGKVVSFLIPPERETEATERRKQMDLGRPIPAYDTVRIAKDGRRLDVSVTQSPIKDSGGRVIGVSLVFRDIAERKQAEERYRATFDNAPLGIMHTGVDDDSILRVNSRLCEMVGYMPDELLAMKTDDILHPDHRGRDRGKYREKMLSGEISSFSSERVLVRKDGSVIWVNRTVSLVRDAAGSPQYFIRVLEDITERTLSGRRLAMEHAVTSILAEAASVGEALPKVIRTICEGLDWICGFHWGWDRPAEVLRCREHWYQGAAGIESFVRASLNMVNEAPSVVTAAKAGGLVRQVWVSGVPVWISDVMKASDFRRAPAAAQAGLHSAFAFPVLSEGRPVGVMEFFSHEIRQPDDALLQIMRAIGTQLGLFIQRKEAEQALRRSEERYRDVFETSPLPMWVWDDETLAFVDVNRATVNRYGYTRDEFLRMNVREIWAPGEDYEENIRKRTQRQSLVLQRRHRTRDGRVIDVEVTARRFTLGGRPVWLTLINDITDRKRAEAALRESEEQFKQLAHNIPQVFWITDIGHRKTIYISPAADALTGRPLQVLYASSRALAQSVHPEDRRRVYEARKSAAGGGYDQTYRVVRPDGTIRWVNDRAFPVSDENGKVYRIAGIAEDVTDRKLAEERLLQLAHYDVLTSLPNRVLFYDRLRQVLAQAKRNQWIVGVLFVDLDRFKNVNDTLGHAVGDQLLQQVSERLTRSVRSGDTVGRLGGDEFAIVLSNLSSTQDANLVAQKIMASFSEPFKLGGSEIFVTASIGITLYPDDSTDQDALIRNADSAMYRAKEMGRNSYQFYTPEMNSRALEVLSMENSLRRALDRDEFLLYYQPKASVADGRIVGVEALLRWQNPDRGLVPPAEFMFVLEETGLIVPVGEWVLRRVCLQIKEWERAGITPVPVAVNLSARQFNAKDFGPGIRRVLEEQGVDPALIELEITESSIMTNTEDAARTLEYLSGLGVGLSIDDFGTGYSSLSYLKRFSLDSLKIDRSFIRDLTTDNDDATITRAVITMAHSLELKVIAEGVETAEQLAFLAEHGCDEIQGYYFSRPVPAEECSIWLAEKRRLQGAQPAAEPGVPSVLLVNDDDDALMLLKHTLDREGYRILLARNGSEAIEAVKRQRVDIVVADQNMPGTSGADLLRHIRITHPDIVRLMTSAHTDLKAIADAISRGEIFRYLPRENTPDQTRASVREALLARRPPLPAVTRPE